MPPKADTVALISAVRSLLYELQNGDDTTVDLAIGAVESALSDYESIPPCGKLGHDPERIVWMCVLPDGHDGDCSYAQRAGRLAT